MTGSGTADVIMDEPARPQAGRPKKATNNRHVRVSCTFTPKNAQYIINILDRRKLAIRGNFVRVLNDIIADHRQVARYKRVEAEKLKERLNTLEKQ